MPRPGAEWVKSSLRKWKHNNNYHECMILSIGKDPLRDQTQPAKRGPGVRFRRDGFRLWFATGEHGWRDKETPASCLRGAYTLIFRVARGTVSVIDTRSSDYPKCLDLVFIYLSGLMI